jgi:hypothetical protein
MIHRSIDAQFIRAPGDVSVERIDLSATSALDVLRG